MYIPSTGGVDISMGGGDQRHYCGRDSADFFGSGEILEFEETVVTGIVSFEQICNSDTSLKPTPTDLESSIIWLISCNYMHNIASYVLDSLQCQLPR